MIVSPTVAIAEFVRLELGDALGVEFRVVGLDGSLIEAVQSEWRIALVAETCLHDFRAAEIRPGVQRAVAEDRSGRLRVLMAPGFSEVAKRVVDSGEFDGAIDLLDGRRTARESLRRLLAGEPAPRPSVEPKVPRFFAAVDEIDDRIVRMLMVGASDKDIAAVVHLSHQSVRNRVHRLMRRSGAANRTVLSVSYVFHWMTNEWKNEDDDEQNVGGGVLKAWP